ncbi:MAG TPA: RsmE family RNA methyltransferase [Polyangiaceae bacterium]
MTRAPIPDLLPGDRRLDGAVGRYLSRVLRLRSGDAFVAFDPATGEESEALVVWADREAITARFGPLRAGAARAVVDVTWIQGLAKADKCDAVVRDATELGATRIVVAATRHSVVKLDGARAAERQTRWERIAREAARQCGRSDPPRVEGPCVWASALSQTPTDTARFCLWEEATAPLGPPLLEALARGVPLAFACGPEGGLARDEAEAAAALGWSLTSLGPLTLRTETVAAAVLGAVAVWTGALAPSALP